MCYNLPYKYGISATITTNSQLLEVVQKKYLCMQVKLITFISL